jgi:hypothetical protein
MANDHASVIGMDDGVFTYRQAPAGTGNISWTTPLSISSTGRLLVGTQDNSGYNNRSAYFCNTADPWNYVSITGGTGGGAGIVFGDGTGQSTANYESYMYHNNSDNHFYLRTNQGNKEFKFTSGGNLELGHGNIKVPSGNGIDFSATGDGGTVSSELFDDYEEGTFVPTMPNSSPASFAAVNYATYTKIGREVRLQLSVKLQATASNYSVPNNSTTYQIGGIPYVAKGYGLGAFQYTDGGNVASVGLEPLMWINNSIIYFHRTDTDVTSPPNSWFRSTFSNRTFLFSIVYHTT